MVDERYTTEGLPIVSEATAEVWLRDYKNRSSQNRDMFGEIERKIVSDNPRIQEVIDICRGISGTENFYLGFLVAYDLLRRQAEANKLAERP